MKKYFEIFLVVFVLVAISYTLLYIFYFDTLCNKFSGVNEKDYKIVLDKLSTCKDSIVCSIVDIERNNKTQVETWNCIKKDIKNYNKMNINLFTK
ncbi:MAG: hypothetical protein PHV23_03915 [Candidatus Gracilibacteria bacterium]|nr:hypothetical protein [Candidatus Gracilibacteria bacterium]